MSGAVDEGVLADILETAGQRAEEIRVEIASLKEKTGNNAVTVPQLLKGDAIPDVTEPAEATRQDEPDASLQFTVSTPSGERQAPPKTEDGTDTEDLERVHAALNSPIQVYVRSSNTLAAGRQGDAAGWPSSAADVAGAGMSDAGGEAGQQAESGSWQGLYQGMLGKLSNSQSTEQQCASNVAAILRSAGMASAVDSANCNARQQHLTSPFAHDCSQAAAVAAGAITSQHQEEEAAAGAAILPSPVHVVEGPYRVVEGEAAAAGAAQAAAENTGEWAPTWSPHSPSKPGSGRKPGSDGGADGSCSAGGADGAVTPKRLVVPPSAADLPVQAVLDELDELLSWSSRTPTHHQQQQQQGQTFARSDKAKGAEEQAPKQQQQQQQGDADAAEVAAAAGGEDGGAAAGADEEEDWVLCWLRSQKGHMSRCNSTSCLLSDEFTQRSDRSSNSSNNSKMRRSCSLPTEPLSRASMSAGGLEAAAASGGGDDEGGLRQHRQQQHDADIKDEILAHLRLAAAFRPRARDSPNSSLAHPCTPPAAAPAAPGPSAATADSSAAAVAGAAASPPAAPATGGAGEAMPHGVSLVDWVGKYIGAQPVSAAPTSSSVEEIDQGEARLQLLCGGVLALLAGGADGSSSFASPPGCSSFSLASPGLTLSPGKAGSPAALRSGGSVSPSRVSSSKHTSAGASKRSSSTDVPSRGSAGVSRTSSAKSSSVGFGSSSARDGSSSAGSSRVWRPGGRRTSAKDDCRKLQDYESARSRILGPVSEAGGAGGSGDVNGSRGSGMPSPKPSEELLAYYRRSSAAEAAEAAAEAPVAGEVPAAGLQLDVLLRAFNALAKRKNTVDKSAALAALMDQIVAVANQAAAAKQGAAAGAAGAELLAGTDARELTVDSDASELAVEGSKLDVLGRSVNSSPRPAGLLCGAYSGRGSPGIAGGCVLQVRKGDMRAGWQSACAERQAAHDSLLSTPRHKRPASAGYAADLAALHGSSSMPGQGGQLGPEEQYEEGGEDAGTEDGLSPTHAMLMHTAARLGEFAGDAPGSQGGCAGIPAEALAAAAPYGNGIVVVRMSTTETSGRLPLLRDTPAGRAVLAGIDGTSLTVQQAVHWLEVGLTRLPSEAGLQGGRNQSPAPGAKRGSRASTPQSPSRRARSRPCSPFRACFASPAALSSEEEEEEETEQQQQQRLREGVHFQMDSSSQLVMVVPGSLAMDPQQGLELQQQQQQQLGGGVHKYTVTGVALPAGEGCQPGVASSGSHCLELITSAGRHRIELASKQDFAGLLAGLNAMLLLKEAGSDAAEKLGALPIEETAWAGAVEGWQGVA
ncbi:hypothetical protein OEZ85_008249 [Tetradesmus obliquus]|uniref:Uncharacterized protein n=1 Tax=Tetradesmus obliquus TaxID=3088 RepID=A0ABY8TIB2_TETOB|nr:hypothetical protein OEZ85_008249 [Tetradesmus obliquus]